MIAASVSIQKYLFGGEDVKRMEKEVTVKQTTRYVYKIYPHFKPLSIVTDLFRPSM